MRKYTEDIKKKTLEAKVLVKVMLASAFTAEATELSSFL